MRIAATIALFLAGIHNCFGASFDCIKATRQIEKIVCSNEELSRLDEQLSVVYERSILTTTSPAVLKDEQRRWLREQRDVCVNIPCTKDVYENRLLILEREYGFYRQTPDSVFVRKLCEKLISPTSREKLLQERTSVDDINNDGRPETIKTCWGGTMNTPCANYFDRSGAQVVIEQVGFEWKDYWTYGIAAFRYLGRTFFLHSSDDHMRELSYLSYITPDNKEHVLCEFNSTVSSELEQKVDDSDGVCQAVLDNSSKIQPVVLSKVSDIPPDALKRSETSVEKSGLADIDNDGRPEKILGLFYASGGGRGCDYNYFEVLNESAKSLAHDDKRKHFLAMQGVAESGYWGRSCGRISNRLFRYRNQTYYEHNVDNNETTEHTVSRLRGNETNIVCKYRRDIRTELKRVN